MSEKELHFGYLKNAFVCSCGGHYGVGSRTPQERAASIARLADFMPELVTSQMAAFLRDFEVKHGKVRYSMSEIGTSSGEFIKANKGQPIVGPVYIHNHGF